MSNPMAQRLREASQTAPYRIEKERYLDAAQEIERLQTLVDQTTQEVDQATPEPESMEFKVYEGEPWHADESEDSVRIFRGHMQIIKAPKRGTPYAEYWPTPEMIVWMLEVLNQAELQPTLDT